MLLFGLALAAVCHPPLVEQLPPQLRDTFVAVAKVVVGDGYTAPGAPEGAGDAADGHPDDEKQWPAEDGGEQAEGERDDPPAQQKLGGGGMDD